MQHIWKNVKQDLQFDLSLKALTLAGLITIINRFKKRSDFKELNVSEKIFEHIEGTMHLAFREGRELANLHVEKELGKLDPIAAIPAASAGEAAISQIVNYGKRQFQEYAVQQANAHLKTGQAVLPQIKIKDSINRRWDIQTILTLRLMVELQRYAATVALGVAKIKDKRLVYKHRDNTYSVNSLQDVHLLIDNGILHPNSSALPQLIGK